MVPFSNDEILKVSALKKYYPIEKGFLRKHVGFVRAVDGLTFDVKRGETVGLVGESGCGKTTTARLLIRAIEPTEGRILFHSSDGVLDLATLENKQIKPVRKDIQMVFQNPYSSLNPRMPILDIISEPLVAFGAKRKVCEERVVELMDLVGLDPNYIRRYPHAFSGGQRQRIGIARALALNPSFVILDEPVSGLDVSIQAQVLILLQELQERLNLTYLFISHDLSVVRYISDRVAVMYMGRIVELAETDHLYEKPLHPYTSALLSAVPDVNPDQMWLSNVLEGEVADSTREVSGCPFAPRCKYRIALCSESPELRELGQEDAIRSVACHLAGELELAGVVA